MFRLVHTQSRRPAASMAVRAGLAILLGVASVGAAPAAEPPDIAAMKALYQRPEEIPFPRTNPFNPAKAELGHKLFFDPRVSGPGTMSCASCHNPSLSWGDGLPIAIGATANRLRRRTPSLFNLAWAEALFWDGRADSLEQQALGPMMAAEEMNQTMQTLIARLGSIPSYRQAFAAAFPGEAISADTISRAVATFERTLVSGGAPFDKWIGGQEDAIGEPAKRGFAIFNTTANCAACHTGWRLTDDSFHDIGLPDADIGRGAIMEGVEPLRHAFKTPGLRDVARRAPYMHNGSIGTLTEVVLHYDRGFLKRPSLSAEIHPLHLTSRDVEDLVAFLKTLSCQDAKVDVPILPVAEND